jgi:hypothetical protein
VNIQRCHRPSPRINAKDNEQSQVEQAGSSFEIHQFDFEISLWNNSHLNDFKSIPQIQETPTSAPVAIQNVPFSQVCM